MGTSVEIERAFIAAFENALSVGANSLSRLIVIHFRPCRCTPFVSVAISCSLHFRPAARWFPASEASSGLKSPKFSDLLPPPPTVVIFIRFARSCAAAAPVPSSTNSMSPLFT